MTTTMTTMTTTMVTTTTMTTTTTTMTMDVDHVQISDIDVQKAMAREKAWRSCMAVMMATTTTTTTMMMTFCKDELADKVDDLRTTFGEFMRTDARTTVGQAGSRHT